MIRLLLFLAALGLGAAGAAWVADRPGTVAWEWLGRSGSLSIGAALAWLAAAAAGLLVTTGIVRAIVTGPRRLRQRAEQRRLDHAVTAISDGLIAAASGDLVAARRAAAAAERAAPGAPLTNLLAAQTAQLAGDHRAAHERYLAMTQDPATRLLGLRGLATEAARAGDLVSRRIHVRAANRADPKLPWAASEAFDAATAERDFADALALNDAARRDRLIDKSGWKRRRAVLLTALAASSDDAEAARKAALEAHALARDLVPAALIAARLSAGPPRRALGILRTAYRAAPHPDLFAAALALAPVEPAAERLKLAEAMAGLRADHVESALGLAGTARAARQFERARKILQPFAALRPTQRVCIAMAEIEAADVDDEGLVRQWLARAVRAPRDPAWVVDGVVVSDWDAVSPVTGALDRHEWRVPDYLPPRPEIDLPAVIVAQPGPGATLAAIAAQPGSGATAAIAAASRSAAGSPTLPPAPARQLAPPRPSVPVARPALK